MSRPTSSAEPPGEVLFGRERPTATRAPSLSDYALDTVLGPTDEDSLSAFVSEKAMPRIPVPRVPRPTDLPVAPQPQWRRVGLAAVGVVALAQTILITLWLLSAWPFGAPDTSPITITTEPAGVPVAVDGVAIGTSPVTTQLSPGPHQVEVGAGASARAQSVDVKTGVPGSVHIALPVTSLASAPSSANGGLEIATEPAGLAVAVDDVPRGVSPLSVMDLAPGDHEVAVTRGTRVTRRTVTVQGGGVSSVLITTAAGGIPSGWLSVTGPVPLQILENGTVVGTSDTPRLLLPVGTHSLTLANRALGYEVQRTVQITAGETASIAIEAMNGTLSVNAQPWAEVWIDGQRIGETPIGNLTLPIGQHELVLRHPQLGERRQTVAVGAGAPTRIGVDLRK